MDIGSLFLYYSEKELIKLLEFNFSIILRLTTLTMYIFLLYCIYLKIFVQLTRSI